MRLFLNVIFGLVYFAAPVRAEATVPYTKLVQDTTRSIIKMEVAENGSLVVVFSAKTLDRYPDYICVLHRDKNLSFFDECGKIGS